MRTQCHLPTTPPTPTIPFNVALCRAKEAAEQLKGVSEAAKAAQDTAAQFKQQAAKATSSISEKVAQAQDLARDTMAEMLKKPGSDGASAAQETSTAGSTTGPGTQHNTASSTSTDEQQQQQQRGGTARHAATTSVGGRPATRLRRLCPPRNAGRPPSRGPHLVRLSRRRPQSQRLPAGRLLRPHGRQDRGGSVAKAVAGDVLQAGQPPHLPVRQGVEGHAGVAKGT